MGLWKMEKIAIREQTPRPHAVTLPVRPLYVHLPLIILIIN